MKLSTMITKRSVTVNFDGQTHTLPATDPSYSKLIEAIKAGDEASVRALVSKAQRVVAVGNATSNANFEVRGNVLYVDSKEVQGELSRQILDFMEKGLPFQPLVNFYRKLTKNPSYRAVTALYSFLEKNKHPITENGNFIAYKRVHSRDSNGKMLDIHSGSFDNTPGNILEMPRNEVDEDPTRTCSAGLHVANWDYAANHFGNASVDVMIEVEVDPGNVVAIPNDYNESKMRVCGYTVRAVVTNPNDNKDLVVEEDSSDNGEKLVRYEDEEEECEEEEEEDCEDCEEEDEEEECEEEEEAPRSPVNAPAHSVPMHSLDTLRRMSTERLVNYRDRLTAMTTLDPDTLRARAATLLLVRALIKKRR